MSKLYNTGDYYFNSDEFQDAVEDECIIAWVNIRREDPRKTVKELIDWHVKVALDPKVSSDAQALIAQGRREAYIRAAVVFFFFIGICVAW